MRISFLRFVLPIALLAFLSACDEPSLEEKRVPGLVPAEIAVDVSQIGGVTGREITIAPSQIQVDLVDSLESALARPGVPNANVSVTVTEVRLKSRGEAFLAQGRSYIKAILTVTDSKSGAVLLAPTEVIGRSEQLRLPGLIGAVTSPSPQADYAQTIRGFADAVRARLFGDSPSA